MKSTVAPWYKNPWVWLIIALPLWSVIAGVITIVITTKHQPEMVVDDYYKKGKAINQELGLYKAFEDSGIKLETKLIHDRIEFRTSEILSGLKITLVHSTQGKRDLTFVVTPNAVGTYSKTLETPISGRWTLFVEPMDNSWKVKQKIAFPTSDWLNVTTD